MKLPFALFGLIAFAASSDASAAGYPERPIRLIVGYAVGGSTDVLARLVGAKLSQLVGQQVVVENKPGANSNIASDYVAHAAPDGYTLEMGGASSAINESLYKKLPFSFARDFAPVAMIGSTPSVMVVPKTLPVQSPAEFLAYANAHRGRINFGSSGIGATTHLSGELFKIVTGVEMTHVPYRGSAPALTDLVSGRLDVMFDNLISATPFIHSGDLRALGMTSPERRASMPDVPTLKEQGYDVVVLSWAGIFAPAGTPQAVIDYLSDKMTVVSAMPDYRAQLETLGVEPQTMTPAALKAFTASEIEKFAKVVAASGASAE